jgi:hypothetical protein
MRRALALPHRAISQLRDARAVRGLEQLNRTSQTDVVAPGGPVVSITSYGSRIDSVYLTVESIGSGSALPSRMILWLDDADRFDNLPAPLARLQRRGLEIRRADNYGPHTKYYPYVESCERFLTPLVTADDDILYPHDWLEGLMRANAQGNEAIHCYRARVIALTSDGLAPYEDWSLCTSTKPSTLNFATGVSGVIYPPSFLTMLKQAGRAFEDCCPKADDIWLHAQALRGGFQVRQINSKSKHFPMIPGTQKIALQDSNRRGQTPGNDRQAESTYSHLDLDTLRVMKHAELGVRT